MFKRIYDDAPLAKSIDKTLPRNLDFPSFCISARLVIRLGEQRCAEDIFAIVIKIVPVTIRDMKCLQMSEG